MMQPLLFGYLMEPGSHLSDSQNLRLFLIHLHFVITLVSGPCEHRKW
jgi:hypothetical protein